MNKIKYRIEFLDEDNSKNTSMIYDYRIENKNVVIIEAENHTNPTDYTETIYDLLKLNNDTIVILDLSNLYGVSKDSLYQWIFIEENNELVDEKFIPINKVRWLKDELKESNKLFKKYFLNKLKKFNNIVAV
ncbi:MULTISPECIES: hypothetical protein [Clostridium]|uniref:hypothetical protein n=1 Tax=Clostridium TaxID=1485 RepID=UPI0006C29D3B|nr:MULTISPECIES: hypothetical protein [Clostridium]CUO75004.1 Uncharacterised protein [Clostridium disporicum]